MELPQPTVYDDQTGECFFLFLQTPVASRDHFSHGSKIIIADNCADNEFPVVGFLHSAVLPNHHAGDFIRALDMGDIEAFDTARRFRQIQRVLKGLGDHLR